MAPSKKNARWIPILRRAANAGKKAILSNYDLESRNRIIKRGIGGDLTLRIDEVSEKAIFNSLKKDLGADSFIFLSEEVGEISSGSLESGYSRPIVISDPLDGSHNAQVGIPFFSVALSVIVPPSNSRGIKRTFGAINAAMILSIKTTDEFFASKGGGAFHNKKKLEPRENSRSLQIGTLLIETGDIDYLREKIITKLTKKQIYKSRLLGSAALSYCMLANGSADAMIFAQPGGARTIDSPAGYLICREAGCSFSALSDNANKRRSVDEVEVGFASRINLVGAPNSATLSALEKTLGRLP